MKINPLWEIHPFSGELFQDMGDRSSDMICSRNIHLDWRVQGGGSWMGGICKIRDPQSAIRNQKGPSENPFPWQAPEGSGLDVELVIV
jgi:hypothetical protein